MTEKEKNIKLRGAKLRYALDRITEEEWIKISILLGNRCKKIIDSKFHRYKHILDPVELVNEAVFRVFKGTEDGEKGRAWDGKDSNGRSVPSGVYFYILKTDAVHLVRKLEIIK